MKTLERRITETLRHEAELLPDEETAHTVSQAAPHRRPPIRSGLAAPAAVVAVFLLAAPLIWLTARRGGSEAASSITSADRLDMSAAATIPNLGTQPEAMPEVEGRQEAVVAEIEVTATEDHYEIEIVTLGENTSKVESDLLALGLDVTIDFVPVSPSLVGKVVATTDSSTSSRGDWEYVESDDFSTPGVLRIPTDFDGKLGLHIGRAAEQGEAFVSAAISALEPGEPLHCTNVEGMTVAEAAPVIAAAGVTVEYYDTNGEGTPLEGHIPEHWYIVSTTPTAGGVVQVELATTLPPDGRTAEYLAHLNEGCN